MAFLSFLLLLSIVFKHIKLNSFRLIIIHLHLQYFGRLLPLSAEWYILEIGEFIMNIETFKTKKRASMHSEERIINKKKNAN